MIWEPDNYKNDPYGYLTNQIGHVYLGFYLVSIYCWLLTHITGVFPDSVVAVTLVSFGYLIFWEYAVQGWKGWDTVEDTLYTTVGASTYLIIDMSEVIDRLALILLALMIPLSIGYAKRLKNVNSKPTTEDREY